MKIVFKILTSFQLMGGLLLLFAVSIGYATFVENDYGTEAARLLVYNARWFEIMLVLMAINLTAIIVKHKMYSRHKLPILLFHISFILIVLGAGITRYFGTEGMMRIRENQSENKFISDNTYMIVRITGGNDTVHYYKKVLFGPTSKNKFSKKFSYGGHNVSVENLEFVPSAQRQVIADNNGKPYIDAVVTGSGEQMQSVILGLGESIQQMGLTYSFSMDTLPADFKFTLVSGQLFITSTDTIQEMSMTGGTGIKIEPGKPGNAKEMTLYRTSRSSLVIKGFYPAGRIDVVRAPEGQESDKDALRMIVNIDGESQNVVVFGGKGVASNPETIYGKDMRVELSYGSQYIGLPFSISLKDFIIERYPGSNSPSSYASEVVLIDQNRNIEKPFKIFMNNILSYRGYRFYQSSYDQDELGTVLSVNRDYWGTTITYLGYFLMTAGMFLTIFTRNSRFRSLIYNSARLRENNKKIISGSAIVLLLMMILPLSVFSADQGSNEKNTISVVHAEKFGKMLIQGQDGRIEPINTLSSELLRKISRKTSFNGLNSDQVFLGMISDPEKWKDIEMIKVKNPEIMKIIGKQGTYISFNQIVDFNSAEGYRIRKYVETAFQKPPASRTKFDKEIMAVDERVNICYLVYTGAFLNIFPIPGDPNHKWTLAEKAFEYYENQEALFVKGILTLYYEAVAEGMKTGNWQKADEHLDYIVKFQNKYGHDLIPSDTKRSLEIRYNKINIFNKLSGYYGIIGFILLIISFIEVLIPRLKFRYITIPLSVIILLLFLAHTAGLGVRWYVSEHAPWSNGYESMIYIGWATMLAGLAFMRRSGVTVAVTAVLTSIILGVSAMSWMDPEITNLVPVLKSYWLIIHVAIISASYGFLGLAALLGFYNLALISFRSAKHRPILENNISDISNIIEMTIIIGLFMLTIGTFLGGVWANESWGRYWGWDPKETWALVTVLVYSFVSHMRFIPGFRGSFALSFAALVSYGTVMMTYFGVNYYLSGLHSYAKGDPVPVPSFVYYVVVIIIILGLFAFYKNHTYTLHHRAEGEEVTSEKSGD